MTSPQHTPSSSIRRRLVPPLVGVTVLAVLLGGGYVLRGGSKDAPGHGAGAAPTVLRLADYQRPTARNPIDSPTGGLFRLTADLPDGPADAPVHWLTSPGSAEVERLAKALGMRGRLTRAGDATTYLTGAATLRVQQGPGGQWQYARAAFTEGTVTCPPHPTAVPKVGAPGLTLTCDVATPVPLGGDATSVSPTPPTGGAMKMLAVTNPAAARAAARPLLEAVGINPDIAVVRAGQPEGFVDADPTVGDLPTHGLTTMVRVLGTRVTSASGWLGGSRAGATYPVISARAAWQQLLRTPMIRPMMACPEPMAGGSDPLICGGPITVTGARFGLSLHEENGRPLLVPSWLFDVRGSDSALSVVAVAPRYLAAPPAPTAGGGSGSSGSGSSGSGSSGSGSVGSGSTGGTAVPPVAPSSAPAPSDAFPLPPESRFSSVTASGTGLVVRFTGGVRACFSYAVVPAETSSQISLSLVQHSSSNQPCVEMAQVYERRVALSAPLGTRAVVDARTGAVLLARSH